MLSRSVCAVGRSSGGKFDSHARPRDVLLGFTPATTTLSSVAHSVAPGQAATLQAPCKAPAPAHPGEPCIDLAVRQFIWLIFEVGRQRRCPLSGASGSQIPRWCRECTPDWPRERDDPALSVRHSRPGNKDPSQDEPAEQVDWPPTCRRSTVFSCQKSAFTFPATASLFNEHHGHG